jgi:signal transduction histidine kinase
MSNLLSNASKFSPPGGAVRVRAVRAGERVRVSVRDDGPGIPDEFRARIFEKFSQADSSATREKGGTGLGLHISQRFIERMQGTIGFESEHGRGATFWIELPVVR